MSDAIRRMAQECYDLAKSTDRPTRAVAQELVSGADEETVCALAVEYLVDLVARAQRATALEVERAASAKPAGIPRKGTKARDAWYKTPAGQKWAEMEAHEEFRERQMWTVIGRAINRYTEEMRIQWTAELLDSTFTLRDGSTVTWGDATIDEHRERRTIFAENAHVNLEGAARHELAIQQLTESGSRTLREMVGAAA